MPVENVAITIARTAITKLCQDIISTVIPCQSYRILSNIKTVTTWLSGLQAKIVKSIIFEKGRCRKYEMS
jgi:hypothetical protein